ncbi:MAG: cbb3-type cytochrome c oxidase subunit I, partial [Anaerolineae bacterium]|nr:cbb3-type cytochrome c oxidase subunit I [Anaerolineae bacterium]
KWFIGLHIFLAFAALSIGILLGPAQTFRRAPALQWEIPVFSYYYQALTLHGVLNAIVFTTFFIMGSSYFVVQRTLQRPLKYMSMAWLSFGMMAVGLVMAAIPLLGGQATVLYTFYAPMIAHPFFYIGLVLVVIGTWVGLANVFMTYFDWRKEHQGEPVPLAVYAILTNFMMWFTATLGPAIEILFMLLPLSLGWIDTTDVQVTRILFWFFGHPLVYFWLIPAYMSWYTMLPKQLGVKLFSDTFGRVAFIMIAVFSIPIGVHHLFVDPGVSESTKLMHSILTFVVAVPSFMTAFNIAATMERSGRKRGATGVLDWLWKQPWGNPIVAAQFSGMILFLFGGVTGLMNASFNMNVALHNTTWVVGHFHTTLGGAVVLTYFGITYWMLPMLRGRKLFAPRLATAQVFLWLTGMLIFAGAMGRAGIEGAARRSDVGAANAYVAESVVGWLNLTAVAGVLLLISSILLFVVLLGTLFVSREPNTDEAPIDTAAPKNENIPMIFERWWLWVMIIAISNILMWGPVLLSAINMTLGFWAPGFGGAATSGYTIP